MTVAQTFANDLTDKFNAIGQANKSQYGSYWLHEFYVEEGKRFDRIVHRSDIVKDPTEFKPLQRFVFAFVERETGRLVKPAGWKSPAKWGNDLASKWSLNITEQYAEALAQSETSGGFLYK